MAILLGDNVVVTIPKPLDAKYLNNTDPYISTGQTNTMISSGFRSIGLTVNINGVEYWYKDGITDNDLVIKDSGLANPGLLTASNGLTRLGTDVKLGGLLTETTTINGGGNNFNLGVPLNKLGEFNLITNDGVNINTTGGFTLSARGGVFTDTSVTKEGIKYAADYSANYVPRSLPDVGYVRSCISIVSGNTLGEANTYTDNCIIANEVTADNGLTKTLKNIQLGGALTKTTNITGSAYDLNLGTTTTNRIKSLNVGTVNGMNIIAGGSFQLNSFGGTITDSSVTKTGLVYGGNYHENYVARSLVDKEYVDTIATGLHPKTAAYVATTGNITLSGIGQTIDGITITNGMRILAKDQTNAANNGVYVAKTGVWSRTPDFDGNPQGEVAQGALVPIIAGNTNINSIWILTTNDPIIIGTNPLNFTKFSQMIGVAGSSAIDVTAAGQTETISVKLATNSGLNTTNGLSIDSSVAGNYLDWNSGVANVNITNINTDLGNPITGATNGLTKIGKNVSLGGTLTIDSTFNSSSNRHLKYGGDYSSQFVARSIPDVAWVCNQITSGGVQTANNGLTKNGTNVSLGGTLTGNTSIDGNYILNLGTPSGKLNTVNIDSTNDINLKYGANAIIIDSSASPKGLTYNSDYSATFIDNSLITKKYLTSEISGVTTNALLTASNGLTKVGQNVKLGGALSETTTILGDSNSLTLGTSGSKIDSLDVCVDKLSISTSLTGSRIMFNNVAGQTYISAADEVLIGTSGSSGSTIILNNDGFKFIGVSNLNYASVDKILGTDINGVVRNVPINSLGEDNNNYSKTTISNNTTLTTNSTYVILVNTTTNTITITLPATPTDGQVFRIKDATNNALSNNITISGNGKNIDGSTSPALINTDGGALEIVYDNALGSWYVFSFVN